MVTLLSDVGGEAPFAGSIVIADGAAPATEAGIEAFSGPTDLEEDDQRVRWLAGSPALGRLLGENPTGRWELLVADDTDGASGSLVSWSLLLR